MMIILNSFLLFFSGGHLNPAVTLAMTIVRAIPVILAPFYVIAQLLGAIIGAGLARVRVVHLRDQFWLRSTIQKPCG